MMLQGIRQGNRTKDFIRRHDTNDHTEAALLTAQRKTELLTLRRENLDLERGILRLSGTSRKNRRHHTISLSGAAVQLFQEVLGEHEEEHVFLNSRGVPYTSSGFSSYFGRLVREAGIENLTFHDLRRHVATELINNGTPLEIVSQLLGHSSLEVTRRRYAHLRVESMRGAVETLTRLPGS